MSEELDGEINGHGWLYNHIGRLTGTVLGLMAFAALAFLSVIGSKSALGLLVVIVFGVFVIAVGGRIRGPTGHGH